MALQLQNMTRLPILTLWLFAYKISGAQTSSVSQSLKNQKHPVSAQLGEITVFYAVKL